MRAITVSDYGSPDVLTISEREQPTMRSGDLLVKVQAVEVTKSDTELRSLNFSVKWFAIPLRFVLGLRRPKREILGMYFSGQVVKLSEGCSRFHVGDEIFGSSQLRLGAYGDYLTVPENYTLSLKPPHISFEEAAAVPLGGLNALHFMRLAKLSSGKLILINGGGGSIGLFAIQIAKAQGAHVTVVDAPHKEAVIRSVGADHFVDYTNQNFTDEPEKFDVFFGRIGHFIQQGFGGQNHARRAKAALYGAAVHKRLLDRMQLVTLVQPFNGGNSGAVDFNRQDQACCHHFSVNDNRAGPAVSFVTPFFGAG